MASLGGHHPGVTPEWNYFFSAEFAKNTGETTLEGGEGRSGDETMAEKGHHFSEDDD